MPPPMQGCTMVHPRSVENTGTASSGHTMVVIDTLPPILV